MLCINTPFLSIKQTIGVYFIAMDKLAVKMAASMIDRKPTNAVSLSFLHEVKDLRARSP